MKKLFLITIILLFQSFPSFGEWVKVEQGNISNLYIEEDTITKRGDLVYVNMLDDYLKPNPYTNSLSVFFRIVINCKDLTYKNIKTIDFKRSMGRGEIIYEKNYSSKREFTDLMNVYFLKGLPKKVC